MLSLRRHPLTHTRVALRREDEGELRGAGDKHRRRTRAGDTSFGGKRRKALAPGFTFMALMGMLQKKKKVPRRWAPAWHRGVGGMH
jgi:hypothetical protein